MRIKILGVCKGWHDALRFFFFLKKLFIFTMSDEEAKLIASYALKIRNLIFPPTSYVSGSGARVVVDVSSREGLVDSLLSMEDGAATADVGTKIGGFRKIVCVSKDSKHENERVQCVTYDGNPVDWLSKEYENVASKSLVLARANDGRRFF